MAREGALRYGLAMSLANNCGTTLGSGSGGIKRRGGGMTLRLKGRGGHPYIIKDRGLKTSWMKVSLSLHSII